MPVADGIGASEWTALMGDNKQQYAALGNKTGTTLLRLRPCAHGTFASARGLR
jgi:hypothetical protein